MDFILKALFFKLKLMDFILKAMDFILNMIALTSGNRHVNYRDGSMMRVHSLACVDPTNCCLAVTPPPPPPPAPCFTSAAAGSSRIAAISVGDNSTAAERFAATELAEHLGNISGVRIPVLRPAQAAKAGNHIAVGYFASLQAGLAASRLEGLGDENFTIASGSPSPRPGSGVRPGLIALSGGYESLRGTQYAVYTFLEWVGVRWWAPDETFFPPCPSSDRFIWAAEEQWYADQGSSTPGAKPVAVRDPGTWTASTHPLWSLRMRLVSTQAIPTTTEFPGMSVKCCFVAERRRLRPL